MPGAAKRVGATIQRPAGLALCLAAAALAGTNRTPQQNQRLHKLTQTGIIALLRGDIAAVGFARHNLPRGKPPMKLNPAGQLQNLHSLRQAVRNQGIGVPRGGRLQITALRFSRHTIVVDFNGGIHTTHWYNHLQFGMGGAMNSIPKATTTVQGARAILKFPDGVPDMSAAGLKQYLNSVVDWNLQSGAAVTTYHLPPVVRHAIESHTAMVGMNRNMIIAALGRTQRKYHEQNPQTGEEYTVWVYGKPPQNTFVKFEGGQVTQITTYEANGTRVVHNHPQIVLVGDRQVTRATNRQSVGAGQSAGQQTSGQPRPSLHRHPAAYENSNSASQASPVLGPAQNGSSVAPMGSPDMSTPPMAAPPGIPSPGIPDASGAGPPP